MEPPWLAWARRLNALAQTGLTFTQDPYDIERYTEIRRIAAVVAWVRHRTTAYDSMPIPRVRGKRREVRSLLAQRSQALFGPLSPGGAGRGRLPAGATL